MDVVDWLSDQARHVDQNQSTARLAVVDEVAQVAQALARDPWSNIVGDLSGVASDVKQVRKDMAAHGWCDLLIGLLEGVTHAHGALDEVGEEASAVLANSIMVSSMKSRRATVTDEVATVVANGLLAAFNVAIKGSLGSILPADLIRALGSSSSSFALNQNGTRKCESTP